MYLLKLNSNMYLLKLNSKIIWTQAQKNYFY